MKGIVFDIQHYAVYDGPGIRTTIYLKGCPLNCLWCHNPESQKLEPEISYFQDRCVKCGTCVKACPNGALSLFNNRIERNQELCVTCGKCVEACPNKVMEIVGVERSSEEITEIICRDKPFYDTSGGGVTISGGEATLQSNFLFDLLACLKDKGIHVALETCGYFNENLIIKLIGFVDLFLYDIKHIDAEEHKRFTGVSNDKILSNFEKILDLVGSERIIVRIPIIPNINTNIKTIEQISNYLKKRNYSGSIHLMPYNKLAKTKYEKVKMGHLYKDMGDLTNEKLIEITQEFEKKSFKVFLNH